MTTEQLYDYKNYLHDYISDKRYRHVMNVVKWAVCLAKRYGADEKKCELAAALHDLLKQKDDNTLLHWAAPFDIINSVSPQNLNALLHGPAAARYIKEEFGVQDEDIISAVYYHTTGKPNMTLVQKIVFLADMIGEDRSYQEVEQLRSLALKDIDRAVFTALKNNIVFLAQENRVIATKTVDAYNDYALLLKRREEDDSNRDGDPGSGSTEG